MDRKHKKAAQLAANGVSAEEIEAVVYAGASYIMPSGGYAIGDDVEILGDDLGAMPIPYGGAQLDMQGKMSYSDSLKSPNMKHRDPDADPMGSFNEGGLGKGRRMSNDARASPVPIRSTVKMISKGDQPSIGSISPANRHQAALLSSLQRTNSGLQASAQNFRSASYSNGAGSPHSARSQLAGTPRGPGDESENFKSRPPQSSVPGFAVRSGSFGQDPIGTPPRDTGSFLLGRSMGNAAGSNPLSGTGRSSFSGSRLDRPGLKTTGFSDPSLSAPPSTSSAAKFSASVTDDTGKLGRDIWGQRTSMGPAGSFTEPSRMVLDTSAVHDNDVFLLDGDDSDDAGEELLPGNLTELLTPRERARRLSRRESGNASSSGLVSGSVGMMAGWVSSGGEVTGLQPTGTSWDSRPNMDALLNRQAMSAGAVDGGYLRSLWNDAQTNNEQQKKEPSSAAGGTESVGGLSSMFAGSTLHRPQNEVRKVSNGSLTAPPDTEFQLGPSNSSAAFLPSYTAHRQAVFSEYGSPVSRGNLHSPVRPSPLHHDSTHHGGSSKVPVQDGLEVQHTHKTVQHLRPFVSPNTRALDAHAPGQSLPQGLAAGLSRLHLRPPNITRSSSGGAEDAQPGANSGTASGVGRYESLARPGSTTVTKTAADKAPSQAAGSGSGSGHGEGEDDDLFEMEG